MSLHCQIKRISGSLSIDGNWNKPAWLAIEPVAIDKPMAGSSSFKPGVQVKAGWDETNIYLIFKVEDCYVKARAIEHFGPVWLDSCVEFFFAPEEQAGNGYFNLETNCIGSILAYHQQGREQARKSLAIDDLEAIELATSLPRGQAIETEISKPLTWFLEYALPWRRLARYAALTAPEPGVVWQGNFYKCVEDNSHPHWLTWSEIPLPNPDFHRPEYFSRLIFTA